MSMDVTEPHIQRMHLESMPGRQPWFLEQAPCYQSWKALQGPQPEHHWGQLRQDQTSPLRYRRELKHLCCCCMTKLEARRYLWDSWHLYNCPCYVCLGNMLEILICNRRDNGCWERTLYLQGQLTSWSSALFWWSKTSDDPAWVSYGLELEQWEFIERMYTEFDALAFHGRSAQNVHELCTSTDLRASCTCFCKETGQAPATFQHTHLYRIAEQ